MTVCVLVIVETPAGLFIGLIYSILREFASQLMYAWKSSKWNCSLFLDSFYLDV